MAPTIRILIVDDHGILRKGLRTLIASEPSMEVVGEAADGLEAIEQTRALQPDVVVMDVRMPRLDGIQTVEQLRRQDPTARILMLSSFGDEDQVIPAIKAGALGYILKDAPPEELLTAIREVSQRRPFLPPEVALKLMNQVHEQAEPQGTAATLTDREIEVLRLIAHGLPNQEIANRLGISERTVSTHITHLLDKLHLDNRTQAALYALREGLTGLYSNISDPRPST
jgi:two-component system, NarL family, response regulator LiaR